MQLKSSLFCIIILISLVGCKLIEDKPPLIPLEDFFRNPEQTNFQISPNGRYISNLSPWENRLNIFIKNIKIDSLEQITFERGRDIEWYAWANDTRILYIKDEKGNEDYKLYSINIDGSDLKCLTCLKGGTIYIIDELKDEPDEIIIASNLRDSTVFDPYRINIISGEMTILAENPGNIVGWMTDHNGKLRLAIAVEGGVNQTVLYRDNELDTFLPVLKTTWKNHFNPKFFTFDNKMIYALSNLGRDKTEVVIFDPKSKTETAVLYKNDEVDILNLFYSRKRKVITTAYYITERQQNYFFDELAKNNFEIMKDKVGNQDISVESLNRDETVAIIKTSSDKSRGSYFLFNSKDESLKKIADISPWLNKKHLSNMEPISYTSRDGLLINGYLTLPKGVSAKNLPAVVMPHGGPWTRDFWEFNPEVQFLVNRGYAVLQMNYRGSFGYGKKFWLKSVKEWGGKMQNDITDGAKWLIAEGIADKNRIAIYGASWGGYAALTGVTSTPELYCCGIDYVGPTNLFTFMNSLPAYWEPMREMFYEMVGDPVKDTALFREISPIFHIENIKAPLLIAQGANDPRVKKSESDQMVNALRERGLEIEYILKEDEGHGFKKEENRFEFYRAMETFLEKHNGKSMNVE